MIDAIESHQNSTLQTRRSLDLTVPDHAYMFGFIQADGHLHEGTRNRGKVQIELSVVDEDLLVYFSRLIRAHCSISRRTRRTNFAGEHRSSTLRVYAKTFRDELKELGMIAGKKSHLVRTPSDTFSKADYFRGVIDADGSLGLTSKGFPFLSLVTASEHMAGSYLNYVHEITGKTKSAARNNRDDVYNIVVYKEDAQAMVSRLYYDDCVALTRKKASARVVLDWKRPSNMKKINFERKPWNTEEDSYILKHTVEESMQYLTRTAASIRVRLWRLRDK